MKFKIILIIPLFMLSFLGFSQQEIDVKGVVTEQNTGDPAIGASVLVKGTTVSTASVTYHPMQHSNLVILG